MASLKYRRHSRKDAFTFLEVMVAMAILALTLTTVIIAQSQSMALIEKSRDRTFLTNLVRLKMTELERDVLNQPFSSLKLEDKGEFEQKGLDDYRWSYTITDIELPSMDNFSLGGGPQQQQAVGPGLIKDWLNKTIKVFELRVIYGDEEKGEYQELKTVLTSKDGIPKFNFGGSGE